MSTGKSLGFQTKTKKFAEETPALIPQSPEEFDIFVQTIIDKFSLPNNEQTKCSIGEMICHLPKTQAHATMSYFADGVRRGIGHLVAYNKVEEIYKPIREAQQKKEQEEKEKAKLTLVENGTCSADEQPVQGA